MICFQQTHIAGLPGGI